MSDFTTFYALKIMKPSHVFEIKQRDQNMFYLHLHYCRYSNAVLWQKCEFNIRVFVENQ